MAEDWCVPRIHPRNVACSRPAHYALVNMSRRLLARCSIDWQILLLTGSIWILVVFSYAQVLQYKRPTEQLVKRYERLVDEGALLTPEGWKRACTLFERPTPYPAHSEIQVQSRPGLIGELSRNGNRAQIETKWGDYYGTIDSQMRFKAAEPSGPIMMGEFVSLVFVPSSDPRMRSEAGGWKIEGQVHVRSASPAAAIRYLEEVKRQSQNPVILKNASKTLTILKRMTPGCGNASAC